ncbi:MAG: class I SAM-dependent methyltransferase [Blastocatellia bacterium]
MMTRARDNQMEAFLAEVNQGERFEFGRNWGRFLALLSEDRIQAAEDSLRHMLEVENLAGRTFLDIGSGSGLFSLAARRLGARVHSFDYDLNSVACTAELRQRYFPGDPDWTVEQGSVLDQAYLHTLDAADVVYSWGVLHHTGAMWRALANVSDLVRPGGRLFIAIYNDQGSRSRRWRRIKRTYNQLPPLLRPPLTVLVIAPDELKKAASALLGLRFGAYLRVWLRTDPRRGMNHWRDIVDWVGGYPYEYAAPEEVFDFFRQRGFTLSRLLCKGVGLGCNEFVFVKSATEE